MYRIPSRAGGEIRSILFLCRRFPYPLDRGDNLRVFHLVEELAKVVRVRVLALGGGPDLPIPGVAVRTVGTRGGAKRLLGPDWRSVARGNLHWRDPRIPLQVRATLDQAYVDALREEVHNDPPDVLHASPSTMAPYLWSVNGDFHRHLDLMDAFSVVMDGDAAAAAQPRRAALRIEARLLRHFEASVVARADSSSLVSASDKRRAPGLEQAVVVPQGVDAGKFPFEDPIERAAQVVFIGNLSWQPNVDAVIRICRDVFPLVRAALPAARFRIVGVGAGADVQQLGGQPGIDVVGKVDSVVPELHGAACALIPMWSGAGMKNKVLEAFAAGTPVVSNDLGLQGIVGLERERHVVSVETPQALAAACVRLCEDRGERRRQAHAASEFVRENYGWSHQADQLLKLYSGRRDGRPLTGGVGAP